jgi:hypothetical protein
LYELETGLALRDEHPSGELERGVSRRTFRPKPDEVTVRRRILNK